MKFVLAVIGLTATAILVTATGGYLVTEPPRGFMVWVGIGFLCTIEFLAGILTVNIFARARCEYRPSGAILAITYGIIGAFAASGLLSIVVYWVLRDSEGSKDGAFTAAMMAITVFWFIVAVVLYAYDLHSQAVARPSKEKRAEHKNVAKSLAPLLSALRAFKTTDDSVRTRVSVALKKLESIDGAFSHSYGGGMGSWEGGRQHPSPSGEDQTLQENAGRLASLAPRFSGGIATDVGSTLTEIEQCIETVSRSLDEVELR
jgi:hypothetical protein